MQVVHLVTLCSPHLSDLLWTFSSSYFKAQMSPFAQVPPTKALLHRVRLESNLSIFAIPSNTTTIFRCRIGDKLLQLLPSFLSKTLVLLSRVRLCRRSFGDIPTPSWLPPGRSSEHVAIGIN